MSPNGYELTEIKFAEPLFYGFEDELSDTYLNKQWNLKNTSQEPGYIAGHDISVFNSWNITKGNRDIVLAIIDTGIDLTHPDLILNILERGSENWDFSDPNNKEPIDEEGHGTAVAGIASAKDNNIGIRGIAPRIQIMPLKVNLTSGFYANRADAINYAVSRKKDFAKIIINLSWKSDNVVSIYDAILNAYNNEIPVFCASGNDDENQVSYPARYSETISVGAMPPCEEIRKSISTCDGENYWGSNYGNKLDISAPGVKIYTTDIQGDKGYNKNNNLNDLDDKNYTKFFWGTSSACPHASATAALVYSVNPKININTLKSILFNTSDKVGNYNYSWNSNKPGHSKELGYGRINAYQAVLLGAAYANKSQYAGALSLNNTRHLDRAGGKVHLIFHSGGEVFYRRSSDNGHSWELTKRLTKGNGSNARESLVAAHDNSVHVVFQHKNDDETYNVMYTYSSDNGSTWSDPVALVSNISVSSNQTKGPQPVITEGYINNTYTLMVVYTSSSGLYYMTKATSSGSWSSPINMLSQQAEWLNRFVWFPGLAAYGNKIILTYDYRYHGIFSRVYDGNWSNEDSTSAYVSQQANTVNDRYASIAKYGNSSYVAAWSAQIDDQRWRVVFRKGNSNNTWSDWFEVWEPPVNISHLQPVITWYDNNDPAESNAIAIIYYDSDKNVYVRKWAQSSNEWTLTTLDVQSQYPSVTMVKSINDAPLYIWSNGAQTPYLLKLQEQSLNKTSAIVKTVLYKRAGVVYDASTQTKHCVEVGDYRLTTRDGSQFRIEFPKYDQEKDLDLNTYNMWSYLESEPFTIPQDGLELSYTQELSTITLGDSSKSQNMVALAVEQFELVLEDVNQGKTVAVLSQGVGSKSGTVDISAYAGRTVIIKPVAKMNFSDSKALSYGLGNIYRDEKQDESLVKSLTTQQMLPEEATLFSNYPNPFNPRTTIRFALPEDGNVQLNIYSVSGQKVRTLLDGQVSKGYHQIVWDGKNESGHAVSGGLYFYELRTNHKRILKKMLLVK
ncbi:S8 family serine peptidase [Calditrichota bacterium GD2]